MKRGTTPTHTFSLPCDTSMIKTILICYAQDGAIKIEKRTDDCVLNGKDVSVTLTQEDTLKFSPSVTYVDIEVSVLTMGGNCLKSNTMRVLCQDCLCDEVLT